MLTEEGTAGEVWSTTPPEEDLGLGSALEFAHFTVPFRPPHILTPLFPLFPLKLGVLHPLIQGSSLLYILA